VKRETSIRFRLTFWYGLVLAAGLIVFAALIWISLRQTLMHEVDQELATRAHSFELFLRNELAEVPLPPLKEELEEFSTALPSLSYLQLRKLDGKFAFSYPAESSLPQTSRSFSPAVYRNLHWHGHAYRVFDREITARDGRYSLEIGIPLDTIQHILNLLQTLLVSLIPAVVIVACLGGIWLSRRALRPVDAMTTAARAISIDNLSSRLPVPQTGDELQRLAEVWNAMLGRLEAAINRLSQFAADASHELRTPLAIIQTSAELALRRLRTPEQYRESLREIVAETERMTQLVEDLLFLARTDASSAEMPVEPLNLPEIVQEACSELQGMAEFRRVNVMRHFPNTPVPVKGNKPALRRLFLVLLNNAIKYSEQGGKVSVEVISEPNTREVVIRDFGVGISPQDLPHIFERFYRSDNARTHADGGHGLGLALAESIARRHNANITVDTSLGKGSEFRVSFAGEQQILESPDELADNHTLRITRV
jgi:two-component system heavy metal sensor histidine kinase CusS